MAAELGQFLADHLDRLPADHPDRAFLAGLYSAITAYTERTPTTVVADATGELQEPSARGERTTAAALYDAGDVAAPVTVADLAQAEQEERTRVVLRGRMGQRVRFTTTKNGVRKAEFNLAVAVDEERTAWHTILAFRAVAETLEQAAPRKGQYAEVIGYRQTEDRTDRAGNPKHVERVIAAHIRLR